MQTYDELLRERDALLLKVEQLLEENRQLRLQLAKHPPTKPIQEESPIRNTPSLSLEEKSNSSNHYSKDGRMCLLADGTAKAPTRVATNPSAKTSGIPLFVTRKDTNVRTALIGNLLH